MATRKTTLSLDQDDVAKILAFLSWHVMLDGAIPTADERDRIDSGRSLILDLCRKVLTDGNDAQQVAA